DKIKGSILYKNLEHKYLTLEEYIENAKKASGEEENIETVENPETVDAAAQEEAKVSDADAQDSKAGDGAEAVEAEVVGDSEEEKKKEPLNVYYVTDEQQQSQYIKMFKEQGQDAVILTHNIDSAFITYLEQRNEDVRFQRIDAEVHDSLKDEVDESDKEEFQKLTDELVELFRKELNNEKLEVKVEKLKDDSIASMAVLSEQSRRMEEMMRMYSMGGGMDMGLGGQATLVLNANHPLVKFVTENKEDTHISMICKQLYDLAMIAHKPLNPEEMTAFVQRSNEIMMLLTK
ncbi:MAG: molecular chaperone HtpG, partial [Ruminococcus sp.]|nr:molecular chaperone HtpG [Ruminococcus sp.]